MTHTHTHTHIHTHDQETTSSAMAHLDGINKELHDLEASMCEGDPCQLLPNKLQEVLSPSV
jgi:hypothetical protein